MNRIGQKEQLSAESLLVCLTVPQTRESVRERDQWQRSSQECCSEGAEHVGQKGTFEDPRRRDADEGPPPVTERIAATPTFVGANESRRKGESVVIRTEVVVVDGRMLEIKASVTTRVLGGVLVVACSEPVVKRTDVCIGNRNVKKSIELSWFAVEELVAVGEKDATIKFHQE